MAYASASQQHSQKSIAFSGIVPGGEGMASESSRVFDVFINHRGPDVKFTVATQLYNSLKERDICAFLDSQEKELGNRFPSTIEAAIGSAKVHIAIFSKRYAESSWCLDELVLMLQSNAKIIPVFYEVEPWELRHIEKGAYAEAFIKHEQKGRYNEEKLKAWKEALWSLSLIAGEEFSRDCDCQRIVAAVQEEVKRKTCLHVAEYPVALDNLVRDFDERLVQDFATQGRQEEGKRKAKVVGIFGMGGAGKTTLAKELFNRKKSNYKRASFLFDVREAYVKSELPSLQSLLFKDLFGREIHFRRKEEGTSDLKDHLRRAHKLSSLIVVDDVDHVEQLNALVVKDILENSDNTLVIVTTRDVGVLISAGITIGYNIKGMDRSYARELFCCHAFDQDRPSNGYEVLVDSFLDVCRDLPLTLQVLGRHVHCRDKRFWELELIKARKMLPQDVKQSLRISFDGLDDEEKQLFMDIACLFLGKQASIVESVLDGLGWSVHHALERLQEKFLLQKEVYSHREGRGHVFIMHDQLRDLGRELAQEFSPPRRLWRPQDLESLEKMGFRNILAKSNIRCFHSFVDESMGCQLTFLIGLPDTFVETPSSLLWLQVNGVSKEPTIPASIPLQNLRFLKISCAGLKTLWENHAQAPYQLKELQICECSALEELRLEILSFLEKICIRNCEHLKTVSGIPELASLIELEIFECRDLVFENLTLSGMKCLKGIIIEGVGNLKYVRLDGCPMLKKLGLHRSWLDELRLQHLSSLEIIRITDCVHLKTVSGISYLASLVELKIYDCSDLVFENLALRGMKCLESITIDRGGKLKYFSLDDCPKLKEIRLHRSWLDELRLERLNSVEIVRITYCRHLKSVSGISNLSSLVELNISNCGKLVFENLTLNGMKEIKSITLDRGIDLKYFRLEGCPKLETVRGLECKGLVELSYVDCPELKEYPVSIGPCLIEKIIIDRCGKVKYFELHGCQNLKNVSAKCVEPEGSPSSAILSGFDHLRISSCENLQDIIPQTTLLSLSVQSCRDLNRIWVTGDLIKLTQLIICQCPKLEVLPFLSRLNCLERLQIDSCEKLKSVMLPTTVISLSVKKCRDLQRVAGVGDLQKLTYVIIKQCPNLEEFPSLTRMSCLGQIEFDSCEKLQSIPGIEESRALKFVQLSNCTNVIHHCIHKLKRVPAKKMHIIGRATDGAESSLNEFLFYDANVGVDEVIEIGTYKNYSVLSELSAVIGCFVVVVDSATSAAEINQSLQHFTDDNSIQLYEGQWVITLIGNPFLMYYKLQEIQGVLRRCRVMKKGFRVEVKKGDDDKIMALVCKIVDKLHYL